MIRIEEWEINPGMYGVTRLGGKVYGHPNSRHEDGKSIGTTPIVSVDVENRTCKTLSGNEYQLGKPAQETFIDISGTIKDGVERHLPALECLAKRVKGYIDSQKDFFRLKAEEKTVKITLGEYPIYRDDVLVKDDKGYTKLTGICVCHLPITDDEVENWDRVVYLEMS